MKKLIIAICALVALSACKKKKNNPMPTPSTNYSQGRRPLPKWGTDTFVCVHGAQNRIDSFYSYVGSNGESLIKHNGSQYVLWIDSIYLAANIDSINYANVQIGHTLTDTNSMNEYQILWHASNVKLMGATYVHNAAWLDFGEPLLNQNSDDYVWVGRLPK